MPGSASIATASARATARVTFFSRVPLAPIAPGSSPPCPASIAITTSRRGPEATAGTDRTGSAGPLASRGYRSITSRWFFLPTGGSRKDFGRVPGVTSMTTRRESTVGCPERRPSTRPCGLGAL